RAVVAPAARAVELGPRPLDDARLLPHLSERVGGVARHVPDRRPRREARHAVAERDVAGLVHRDAAHPPMVAVVRTVGALLVDAPLTAGVLAQLVPAHAGAVAAHVDRVGGDDGLVSRELAVL